jgi:hypothetical protein
MSSIFEIKQKIYVNDVNVNAYNNDIYLPASSAAFDFVLTFDTQTLVKNNKTLNFRGASAEYVDKISGLDATADDIMTPVFFSDEVTFDSSAEVPLSITFDQTNVIELFSAAKVVKSEVPDTHKDIVANKDKYASQINSILTSRESLSSRLIEIVAIKVFANAKYSGGFSNREDFEKTEDESMLSQLVNGISGALADANVIIPVFKQIFGSEAQEIEGSSTGESEDELKLQEKLKNSVWKFPIELNGNVTFDEEDETDLISSIPVDTWGTKLRNNPEGSEFDFLFTVPIQLVLTSQAVSNVQTRARVAMSEDNADADGDGEVDVDEDGDGMVDGDPEAEPDAGEGEGDEE